MNVRPILTQDINLWNCLLYTSSSRTFIKTYLSAKFSFEFHPLQKLFLPQQSFNIIYFFQSLIAKEKRLSDSSISSRMLAPSFLLEALKKEEEILGLHFCPIFSFTGYILKYM